MRAYQKVRILRARARGGAGASWNGVRILGYHRVTDTKDDLAVAPTQFRIQMEAALASGAKPIRLEAALDLLREHLGGCYFSVTFDDGYHDNLVNAVPVLRELSIPATIFLPTGVIDGKVTYHWYKESPRPLTWEDVADLLQDGLVDFQAHTRTHPRLPRLSDADAWDEIAGSKRDIEQHLPYKVTSLCYPAGLYGDREVRFLQEAGYRAGVTCDPGINSSATPLETLRRTMIYWGDTRADFEAKMAGLFDRPPLFRSALYRYLSGRPTRELGQPNAPR